MEIVTVILVIYHIRSQTDAMRPGIVHFIENFGRLNMQRSVALHVERTWLSMTQP